MTMNSTGRCLLAAVVGVAVSAGCAAQSQGQAAAPVAKAAAQPAATVPSPQGPWIGTWRRRSDNPAAPATQMRMWLEDDGFRYAMETVLPSGEVRHNAGAFARFDGKPYPEVGNAAADYNIFTRVDDRTYALEDIKDGKVTFRFRISISPDGKTRTSVSTRTDENGKEVTSTGISDRVN